MAPLLRASFHGLRRSRALPSSSLSSQREALKPPESSYILWRWYGESAALEETCSSTQTVNDTAGESRAVNQGEDSSKTFGALKETLTANAVKQESATKESPSTFNNDKLASEIIGKLRNRNNLNGPKANGVTLQADSTSSKTNKLPEASSQHARDDKLQQVVNSMRIMAAKKSGNLASGGSMSNLAKTGGGNQDDFADLDLPQVRGEAIPSRVPNNSDSFSHALRNFTKPKEGGFLGPNAKQKDSGFLGLNAKQKDNGFQGYQQKAKETKPVSFSFLKSFDASSTTSGVTENDSFFSSNASDQISSLRSSLQGFQPSFDSLKSVRGKNEPSHEVVRSAPSHEVKGTFSHDAKGVSSHESKSAFTERMERASPSANEVIIKATCPGYTVCIRNLPSHSNLALVKEALSLHGEIISSFKKPNSDGSCNAFVEFKTADAMDGALATRWVNFDSKAFSIVRADVPITTVVRLSKVSLDTTDSQLFSICEKFGGLDNIKKRGNGVYDVYYKSSELSNMTTILDSLNEVTLNQRRLVALPAPLLHPAVRKEVLKGSEGQAWHASQLSQTLNRIECGLDLVSVCFEDLKALTAMEDEWIK